MDSVINVKYMVSILLFLSVVEESGMKLKPSLTTVLSRGIKVYGQAEITPGRTAKPERSVGLAYISTDLVA